LAVAKSAPSLSSTLSTALSSPARQRSRQLLTVNSLFDLIGSTDFEAGRLLGE